MMKDRVVKAYEWSKLKHAGQKRKYVDLEYFSHPKWVARTLEDTGDEVLIIAGLIHDVLEDCCDTKEEYDTTLQEIILMFGQDIADIAVELCNDREKIKKLSKIVYMSQKILSLSYRATIVKLVDRIHNLLFAETDNAPYDFIKKYYKESIQLLKIWEMRADRDDLMNKYILMLSTVLEFYRIRYNNFIK